MPVISDGTGTYTIRPDGTKEYGCMTCFEVNGKKLYDFNQETGVLQVSMSPSDLEILLEQIGNIPEEGKDLVFPTPIGEPARFKSVKKIESIPGIKENDYMMKISPSKK